MELRKPGQFWGPQSTLPPNRGAVNAEEAFLLGRSEEKRLTDETRVPMVITSSSNLPQGKNATGTLPTSQMGNWGMVRVEYYPFPCIQNDAVTDLPPPDPTTTISENDT